MTPEKKISYANIIFLITIGLSTVVSLLASFLPLDFLSENLMANVLLSQGLLILPTAVFMITQKLKYTEEVKLRKMKFGDILLTILFGFLIQPILTLINALSLVFTQNEISNVMFSLSKQVPYGVALLLVALTPAIFEETVYRGFLYQSYRKANPWRAVLLSGFLFGLMHGNLNQFSYAFVMGIIFALLIEATGSILSTMIIHFVTNAISVTGIYMLPKAYDLMKESYNLYGQMGLPEMQEYIVSLLGDMTLTSDEWISQLLKESQNVNISFGAVMVTYLPQAIIFGALAFLVFKTIAKRNSTWNSFCITFLGADNVVINEPKNPYSSEINTTNTEGIPGVKLVTIPLMIAIAIGVVMMFIVETLRLLPQ